MDLPIDSITIPEDRIRKELGDMQALSDSIARRGLINPITLSGTTLVAGYRRLLACKELHWTTIPTRDFADLSPTERRMIEIEENIKRKDFDWKEYAAGISEYVDLTSVSETVNDLSITESHVYSVCSVAHAMSNPKSRVKEADTLRSAINIVVRERGRAIDDEISRLEDQETEIAMEVSPVIEPEIDHTSGIRHPSNDLMVENFLTWAPKYNGQKFNLLHCDFPYGINIDGTEQFLSPEYEDTPELYKALCSCLADNLKRLTINSAHIIFWTASDLSNLSWTHKFFTDAGLWVCPVPLVWHKSDNRGIVSDIERRPRHIYETAFLMSRGDRKIIQPLADTYSAPTGHLHPSEKPEPVLRHFFRMLVDDTTELLDPTCGAGSALRAVESLGARRVLGLDRSEEHISTAKDELRRSRMLRAAQEVQA